MPGTGRRPPPRRGGGTRPTAARRPADRRPAQAQPRARRNRAAPAPTAGPAPTGRRPSRRLALTGRAAILALVLASISLALVVPTRVFVGQRHQIAQLRAQAQAQQAAVDRLRRQQQLLANPQYVEAQASQELHFVLPGQTLVEVYGPVAPVADRVARKPAPVTARPWYSELWGTVVATDRLPRTGTRQR